MSLFSQLPSLPAGAIETWLLAGAAVGSLVVLAKKLLPRKSSEADFLSKTDLRLFGDRLDSLRDRVDARFLSLSEKIEGLGASLDSRLARIESGLARLDERTKFRTEKE